MGMEIKKVIKMGYIMLGVAFAIYCLISLICIYGLFQASKARTATETEFNTRRFEDSKYVIVEKTVENVGNVTVTVDKENKVVYVDEETIYNEEEEQI